VSGFSNDYGVSDETFSGGTPDDEPYCGICGGYLEDVDCWQCQGEGGFHDCGEDTCCCLDKEEITVDCEECDGEGSYLECASLPHTEEQMAAWRARKQPKE
jgi:hypothetical protein